jgi:hypothetical protein
VRKGKARTRVPASFSSLKGDGFCLGRSSFDSRLLATTPSFFLRLPNLDNKPLSGELSGE